MSTKSNIIAKIKELFAQEKMAKDYTTSTGQIIRCLGESLSVGEKVVEVVDGQETTLNDGNYLLEDGKTITVEAGEIKEINEYKAEENMAEDKKEEIKDTDVKEEKMEGVVETKLADGTEVRVIVAGDQIAVGDKVEVKDAEGNFVKAPEGKHETVEGLIIYVDAEGLINEIETKETEEEDVENEEMKSMFEAIKSLKAMADEFKKSLESMKNENKELKEKFNKFAAEPSATSITKSTQTISKTASKEGKLKFFGTR